MKAKAVSAPKKKPASPSRKKADSPPKKKPASPSRGKSDSLAKEKLELSNQVNDFARAAFRGRRISYFVLNKEKSPEGSFIVCVAIENEAGYYKLDWGWHCSLTKAKAETALMNKDLGLTQREVEEIILSTMLRPTCQ